MQGDQPHPKLGKMSFYGIQQGVVLGHVISNRGIAVDKAKVEVIERLPPPSDVNGIRSFLGHTGFLSEVYQGFF